MTGTIVLRLGDSGHELPLFVEIENAHGRSIAIGTHEIDPKTGDHLIRITDREVAKHAD